jgi:hypothetical protein
MGRYLHAAECVYSLHKTVKLYFRNYNLNDNNDMSYMYVLGRKLATFRWILNDKMDEITLLGCDV